MSHAHSLPGSNGCSNGILKQTPCQRTDHRPLLSLFLLYILTLLSCGTNPDSDKDGLPDDKDHCPTEYSKVNKGCPPEEKINAIRFFIDKSASMNGYYKGDADFTTNIGNLLTDINPKEIWIVGDSMKLFNGDRFAFTNQMLNRPAKGGQSSMLDVTFRNIADKTGPDDISIFVSDGIWSYATEYLRQNPTVNKDAEKNISWKIRQAFGDFLSNRKNLGVSLYAFKAPFTDTYYNYKNEIIKFKGEERPYYIWVLGKKNLLRKFNTDLKSHSTFQPQHELHFGIVDSVTTGAIVPSYKRVKGQDWIVERQDGKEIITNIGKAPARFSLAIDMSKLPAYAQSGSYLKDYLHAQASGCDILPSPQVEEKKQIDVAAGKTPAQQKVLDSVSHVFFIDIKRMYAPKADLQILLPVVIDNWYVDWSCDIDDLKTKKNWEGQTFAFRYLVDGIKEAYEQTDKHYISITIPLKQ